MTVIHPSHPEPREPGASRLKPPIDDFLLARIAEDEAPSWNLVPYTCEPGCCAPAGWVGHECSICRTREFGGAPEAIAEIAREHDERVHARSRVLAECEAKRRIVAAMQDLTTHVDHPAARAVAADVLGDLATIYADHPDYRPEWAL